MASPDYERFMFAMVMNCKEFLAKNPGKRVPDFLEVYETKQLFAEALATKMLTMPEAEMVIRVVHSECGSGEKAN